MPELPESFPWRFGGYVPPDDLYTIEGTNIGWTEDTCESAKANLLQEFRDKPRFEAVLCAFAAGVQDLHDACYQVLTERWLDSAVGVQLDGIGGIVGLGRRGWGDETYRQLLRAWIRVLRSKGRWDDLFEVLELLGFDLDDVTGANVPPAGIYISLAAVFTVPTVLDVFSFLERTRAGGVSLSLVYVTAAASESFTLSATSSVVADDSLGLGDSVAGGVGGYLAGVIGSG